MVAHTLFDKIWARHTVHEYEDGTTLLYIDRHLVHEVTSPQAFEGLKHAGRQPRRPRSVLAVPDHNVPTTNRRALGSADPLSRIQIQTLERNCAEWDITMFSMEDSRQGIVHVVGPEQGFTLPGMTIVCGDSHTSTHGAFGALAFGIGASEVEHVLATQCLTQKRPRTMDIRVDGQLSPHCSAKDMILAIIGHMGTAGGTGYVVEYTGEAVRSLSMEGRMTLCNMTIEGGARAGMIAPDATTFSYIRGRPLAPPESLWPQAVHHWEGLCTDPGATHDRRLTISAEDISPQITWGTNPGMVTGVEGTIPDPRAFSETDVREATVRALEYMALRPGTPMVDIKIDRVFIGSCTNARIEDLRLAASYLKGRKVASGVQAMVVPGSGLVKQQAEEEGLDEIFRAAGAEWREAGCSMCLAMNADMLQPGERCASTSNRNFEGRQGKGGRTHLVSPAMAAAAAIAGHFVDIRHWA